MLRITVTTADSLPRGSADGRPGKLRRPCAGPAAHRHDPQWGLRHLWCSFQASGFGPPWPAWASAFAVVLNLYLKADIEHPVVVPLFEWINLSWGTGAVSAFGLYLDSLTLLWMLFVTGLGALIALLCQ